MMPVDEVEQVEGDLGRHRRQAEAQQPAQQGAVEEEREAAALQDDQAEDEGGAAGVAAEQQAAGALVGADDEDDGEPDRDQDVDDRRHEEGPGALFEPEQGEHELEHRQHPEAADRDPRQVGGGTVEQRFGDRRRRTAARSRRRAWRARRGRRRCWRRPGRDPRRPCSRSAAAPRSGRSGRRCWRRRSRRT